MLRAVTVSEIRRIRGREVPASPPWKGMAVVAALGLAVMLLGLAVDSSLLAVLGGVSLALAGLGFLVPAYRDRRAPQQVDRESSFGFVLSLLRPTSGRNRGSSLSGQDAPSRGASHGGEPEG